VISGVLKKWLTKFFESGRGEKKEKKKKTTKSRLESVLVSYESDEWKLRRREKEAKNQQRSGEEGKSPEKSPVRAKVCNASRRQSRDEEQGKVQSRVGRPGAGLDPGSVSLRSSRRKKGKRQAGRLWCDKVKKADSFVVK
jgi:hypothetical protein